MIVIRSIADTDCVKLRGQWCGVAYEGCFPIEDFDYVEKLYGEIKKGVVRKPDGPYTDPIRPYTGPTWTECESYTDP